MIELLNIFSGKFKAQVLKCVCDRHAILCKNQSTPCFSSGRINYIMRDFTAVIQAAPARLEAVKSPLVVCKRSARDFEPAARRNASPPPRRWPASLPEPAGSRSHK